MPYKGVYPEPSVPEVMNSPDFRSRCVRFTASLFFLTALISTSRVSAQPVSPCTLASGASTVQIDPNSQFGVYNWSSLVGNQLAKRWFWYSVGSDAPMSIDTISAAAVTLTGPTSLITQYVDSQNRFDLTIEYSFTGDPLPPPSVEGPLGSDLTEFIGVHNRSTTSPLDFHFYEYTDFNLFSYPPDDSLVGTGNGISGFVGVTQSKYGSFAEEVVVNSANHAQAGINGEILAELNGNSPVTLNDYLDYLDPGPGDIAYAFEWDNEITPGGMLPITTDTANTVALIPEPSVMSLLFLGLIPFILGKVAGQRQETVVSG
jgi:hypothetical protein